MRAGPSSYPWGVANDLTLASDFPAPTREDWLAAVGKALKGADFERTLVTSTDDGIRIDDLIACQADFLNNRRFARGNAPCYSDYFCHFF